jgi:hypothetical protein
MKLEEKNPLECGHWLHISCVQKHFKPECPLCRQPLNIKVYGTKPQPDMNLFIPHEQEEQEEVQGIRFIMRPGRNIVAERNVDEDELQHGIKRRHDSDDEDEPWRANGYQYAEEDSEYDEENPRGDNWNYEDI